MRFDRRVGEPLPSSALRVHAPFGSHCQRGASRLLRRAVPMSWAGAVVGDVAGPGLWHQSLPPATTGGWRLLCPENRPRQLASAAQGAGAHSPLWPTAAGTDRKRNPPRHRPAEAVAAPGAALEPGMAAARTLTGSQAQPGGHSPCPCIKTPYIPLSGGTSVLGLRARRSPARPAQRRPLPSHRPPSQVPGPVCRTPCECLPRNVSDKRDLRPSSAVRA